MSEKALFDLVHDIFGRGLTQAEVNRIKAGAAKPAAEPWVSTSNIRIF